MSQIHRARNGKFSTKKAVDRIEEFVKRSKSRKTSPLSASDSHIDHSYSNAFTPNDDLISDFVHVPNDLLDIGHCRFIVELDLVASQLKSCSNNSCENPLYLHKALGVRPYGLSGIVYIPCECGELNKLRLGKTHHGDNPRGVGTFDVNTKAAAGMLHSGIGESQLNNLFSTMNVHCIDAKSLKVREIEAGTAMEVFAEESEKKCLTEEAAQSNDTEEPKGISLSTDTCWQKKGSGRSYNSLSGVASLIGKKTGSVLKHSIRCKQCRICDQAKKKGILPRKHKCRLNWTGTSKGMEPDMVVELLTSVEKDVKIDEVAGDDDTTGFERAKRCLPESTMKKSSDRNHVKKNVVKQLIEMKPRHKELSTMVVNSISKNFSYMVDQNQGDKQGIENGLHAVANHPFGNHSYCSSNWCGYLTNTNTYKHSNLPYGRDLKSTDLKEDIEKLFINKLMKNSDKLATLSSSQANESLNNLFALKAPKTKHYSSSASLSYRVCSAVLQKNEGYAYVPELNKSIGMSPGSITIERSKRLDRKRNRKSIVSKTKQSKRNRLLLKKKRTSANASLEIREGTVYESEIGLNGNNTNLDEEEIPPTTEHLESSPELQRSISNDTAIVVFDLETTSLARNSDIIQISAQTKDQQFDTYVFPNQKISPEAATITQISVSDNQMYYKCQPVPFKLQFEALTDFLFFIRALSTPPILVGHNIKRFDCHVLFNTLKNHNLWAEFVSHILGFLDSIDVIKFIFPDMTSYSQTNIVKEILGEEYSAHNAVEDTKLLYKLLTTKCNIFQYLVQFTFCKEYPIEFYNSRLNLSTFIKAIEKKAITKGMALKAAKSNLKMAHVQLAVRRNGIDGLKALLSEKTPSGKVRVTNCSKVILKLYEYCQALDKVVVNEL